MIVAAVMIAVTVIVDYNSLIARMATVSEVV